MTLDQLRTLVTVVEEGGFQKASEGLLRSRSALSVSIKNLEQEMGFSIFTRNHYRLSLTEYGKKFYDEARKLVKSAENLEYLGQYFAHGNEPEIRITANAICPLESIVPLLHEFELKYPTTKIIFRVEHGPDLMKSLYKEEDEVDIVLTDIYASDRQVEMIHWRTIQFVPVMGSSFPLANKIGQIQRTDLLLHRQIVVSPLVHEEFDYWVVSNFSLKKQFILNGIGWGMLPKFLMEQELEAGLLLPFSASMVKALSIPIWLARRLDRPIGPLSQTLWKKIQQLAKLE